MLAVHFKIEFLKEVLSINMKPTVSKAVNRIFNRDYRYI